mmetsp:Transcript_65882/g.77410  ORF Transcript_65882/g.77410 Transcript_65882/m.77410 type:complete len:214 (-) Transcript_65882:2598-3239(-)
MAAATETRTLPPTPSSTIEGNIDDENLTRNTDMLVGISLDKDKSVSNGIKASTIKDTADDGAAAYSRIIDSSNRGDDIESETCAKFATVTEANTMVLILPITEESDNCEINLLRNTCSFLGMLSRGNMVDNTIPSLWLSVNSTIRDTAAAAVATNNDESTIEDNTCDGAATVDKHINQVITGDPNDNETVRFITTSTPARLGTLPPRTSTRAT